MTVFKKIKKTIDISADNSYPLLVKSKGVAVIIVLLDSYREFA